MSSNVLVGMSLKVSFGSELQSFKSSNETSIESQTFSGKPSNAHSMLLLGLAHLPISLLSQGLVQVFTSESSLISQLFFPTLEFIVIVFSFFAIPHHYRNNLPL